MTVSCFADFSDAVVTDAVVVSAVVDVGVFGVVIGILCPESFCGVTASWATWARCYKTFLSGIYGFL